MKRTISKALALLLSLSMLLLTITVGASGASAAPYDTGYRDVAPDDWYADAVAYVSENGLMNGTGDGLFAPDTSLNRAMFVTILGRITGVDDTYPVDDAAEFSDVEPGDWYAPYVAWAAGNGITKGLGDGSFGAERSISRQDMATMIARWLEGFDLSLPDTFAPVAGYGDLNQVDGYALEGLELMRRTGIIRGDANGNFNPKAYANRAEAATVMMRLDKALSGEDPAPEPSPEPSVPQYVGGELTVGNRIYALGTDVADYGVPDEITDSFHGAEWYFYGTDDYTEFAALGVLDGTVVAVISAGVGFEYQGMTCGGQLRDYAYENCLVRVATDENDNDIVHGVFLADESFGRYFYDESHYILSALEGECRMNFHLTNAFRVYHEMSPFVWSEKAERSALLHSQDMAEYDYFSHTGRDGSSLTDRMNAQGIVRNGGAENIGLGYRDGFSLYEGLVNSSGHRNNILSKCTHMGVGAAYNPEPERKTWFTQNMYVAAPGQEPEPEASPEPSEPVMIGGEVTVGGTTYTLGEEVSQFGRPDEVVDSFHGGEWYFYGTNDYTDFVALGVEDGKIIAIAAAGVGFEYQGFTCGDRLGEYTAENCVAELVYDTNDNTIVHGVYLTDEEHYAFRYEGSQYTAAAMEGECRMNFHLTNAFRVYHGLTPFEWSDKAAEAARLHSQDMADQDYFSHTGKNGSTVGQRLGAQNISWWGWAENIAVGYRDGFSAYNGWVNSDGHRKNMLIQYNYMGVGAGYNADIGYGVYYTQDMYEGR